MLAQAEQRVLSLDPNDPAAHHQRQQEQPPQQQQQPSGTKALAG